MAKNRGKDRSGGILLVLHAHIPYVLGYGTWPHGEDWLFEVTAESYLPLIKTFERLAQEGFSGSFTISLSPTIILQTGKDEFKEKFEKYLTDRIKAAERDWKVFQSKGDPKKGIAHMWVEFYRKRLDDFRAFNGDIVGKFRDLEKAGVVELITTCATHGYLPLFKMTETVRLQIRQGLYTAERKLGEKKEGIWLPECAYRPEKEGLKGIEEVLSEEGVRFTFIDAHMIGASEPAGEYGVSGEPIRNQGKSKSPYTVYFATNSRGNKGVYVFVRDPVTSRLVWSREVGYPGDQWYLDFHKKAFPSGLRYWRVCDPRIDLAFKELFRREMIEERIDAHSSHFIEVTSGILKGDSDAVIVAPYDAELYGHWWFEGPEWLYHVAKKAERSNIKFRSPLKLLEGIGTVQKLRLHEGSWGLHGGHEVWMNPDTEWMWKNIWEVEREFWGLAGKAKKIPSQIIWEFLLLTASDWPFLISTWQARDYAEMRFNSHLKNTREMMKRFKSGAKFDDNFTFDAIDLKDIKP